MTTVLLAIGVALAVLGALVAASRGWELLVWIIRKVVRKLLPRDDDDDGKDETE